MQGEWNWMGKMPSLGSVLGGQQDTAVLPQDDSMAQLETQRKMKLAQALQNQQMPEGQMVSGHYVAPSWTQYLNTGVRNYQGQKKEQEAIKGYGDYQQSKQKRLADALQGLNEATAPKAVTQDTTYQIQVPNVQAPQTENLGGMQPVQTNMKSIDVPMTQTTGQRMPTAAERDAAMYKFAVATQNPELMSKVAFGRVEKQDQQEALRAQREYEQEQLNNKRQYDELLHKRDRGEKLSDTETANLFALDKMRQEQGFTAGQNALNRGVTMRGQNMSQLNQPPIAVLDKNGNPTYVPRNQAVGMQPYNASQPVTTQQGKINDARDVISILNQAQPLIDKSTSSGAGHAYDVTKGFFGGTTQGAQAAAQLKALEGSLVSKMPKMSGPQSDKDVLLYRQMAGEIGDPTIPAAQKKAAMDTIREINQRYLNNTQGGNAQPQANTKTVNGVTYVNDGQGWHPQ